MNKRDVSSPDSRQQIIGSVKEEANIHKLTLNREIRDDFPLQKTETKVKLEMKTFNFRKLGIISVMMLVGAMVLVGSASASTGDWSYATGTGYKVGAYGEYSNSIYGFIYGGSAESTAGSKELKVNAKVYNTDASSNPTLTDSGFGTIISTTVAYYSTNHLINLHDYNPYTVNYGKVGSGYHSVTDHPDP
ncbi:hypothetical protein [Methanolacinia petrolearia]|uniref:hypothetical protein n=1 Tax=Methanolacinia petrolearia TaxID=54120 RepID=UPI003BAB75A4